MLQVICFTKGIKIKVLMELTRNEFLCETSFPAKLVSLPNEFPCETSKRVCKTESPILRIPIFIENSTHPFFANFQIPHPPLNIRDNFPVMKGVLRVLILC